MKRIVSAILCLVMTLAMDCAQKPSPFSIDLGLLAVAASRLKTPRFVYITDNTPLVYTYLVNPSTCALTLSASIAAPASPWRPVIDPTGQFLFVPGNTSNLITSYRINSTTGSLMQVGSVVATSPLSLAYDPAAGHVISASSASSALQRFSVQSDGTLISVVGVGATATASGGVAIDPMSRIVFVPHATSIFSSVVLSSGSSASASAPAAATGIASNGTYLFIGGNTFIYSYLMNGTFNPSFVGGFSANGNLNAIAADSQGTYVYGATTTATLNRYTVSYSGTVSFSTQTTLGSSATSVAVDPAGYCGFAAGTNWVTAFRNLPASPVLSTTMVQASPNALAIASY